MGEITARADVAQLCSSSKIPLAPQPLPLQAWVVTSPPDSCFAGLCPKSHLWALISPISACFPADSWLVFIIQRNSAQTPRGFPGDAVTPRLGLREQAKGSVKQANHPFRAAENRDSWPCLQTNALSFLGQEPGILRASGQVTTWYWHQLRNIRWNFNYHWKIQLEKPSLLFKELKAAQSSHLLSSKK